MLIHQVPATVTKGVRLAASTEAVPGRSRRSGPRRWHVRRTRALRARRNPVIAVPGESPDIAADRGWTGMVIALPASTAKDDAVPRFTVAVAAIADGAPNAASVMNAMPVTNMVPNESRSVREKDRRQERDELRSRYWKRGDSKIVRWWT